jgi:hypothetical protein
MSKTKRPPLAPAIQWESLQSVIDNIPDLIWAVNRDLEIMAMNRAFDDALYSLTGARLSIGDYILSDLIAKDLCATWKGHYEKAMAGNSFRTVEIFEANQLQQMTETSFTPIKDANGTSTGVSCVARNITLHHEQLIKLEQQNETLRQIAWIQSHRVRSHVSTILGLSQFVTKAIIEDPELNTIMDGIKSAATELDSVIKEINKLTKSADLEHP